MNGTCRSVVTAASRSAVMRACFSFSIAHGPPMRTSGWPPPMRSVPTAILIGARGLHPRGWPEKDASSLSRSALVLEGGADEAGEQGVRVPRARAEFGMELSRDEVGMLGQLDDLHELLLGPHPRHAQPVLLHALQIVVVDLVAVTVTLLDDALAIQARGMTALAEHDRVEAEPHRPALGLEIPLLGQEVDDGMPGGRVELRRVGAVEPADVPGELDDRALHAQTDAEVRHPALPGIADRLDLALDPAIAEAAGHENPVHVAEVGGRAVPLDLLGVDPHELDPRVVGDASMRQGLDEALVRVLQLDVLADDGDAGRLARGLHAGDDRLPPAQVDGPRGQAEELDDDVVEPLAMEHQRHLVDRLHVLGRDDGLLLDVAEERDLRLDRGGQIAIGATEQDVGLDPDGPQLLDRMLRRLGLELLRGLHEGHEREMDVDDVVAADVLLELADGLQER